MTNPLSALRFTIDLTDADMVTKWTPACEASGVYLDELQADGDPSVTIYDCNGDLLSINCNFAGILSLTLENSSFNGTFEELEDRLLGWAIDEGYTVPGFAPEAPDRCPAAITCKADMNAFIDWLFTDVQVAYHWDEMASQYVDREGNAIWTPQQAKHVDNLTEAALTLDADFFQSACIEASLKANA